ncbi:ribosomal-processing cysteine protease Prp, partial [Geobacillus thermodenitrificans]
MIQATIRRSHDKGILSFEMTGHAN